MLITLKYLVETFYLLNSSYIIQYIFDYPLYNKYTHANQYSKHLITKYEIMLIIVPT